jgi:N-acetylneuraminic acid mutarotase
MRTRKLCLLQGPLLAFFLAFAIISPSVCAQTSEWAWMGGSSVIPPSDTGPPGVYGTLGVAGATNVPGGRYYAVSWTDKQGNLWLFGGEGEDAVENYGILNDLWEFNVTTREWTWMSGNSTIPGYGDGQPGVYGQLGIPGTKNTPGGRFGAFGWADQQGNLWLFGGGGFDSTGAIFGYLNDLWEYNIVSGEWTWMSGSSTLPVGNGNSGWPGVHGALGSLTSGSYPGGRGWGVVWTDPQGSFWMFGGFGANEQGQINQLNDLWKFVPSTRQWAWMGGNSEIGGTAWYGVYGQLGTPASGNTPGARESPGGWVDAGGNLWLFGGDGQGLTSGGQTYKGDLNDLWEFSPTTNEWAWMGGSNLIGSSGASPGVNGTLGTFSAANIPGARVAPVVWVDSAGNAWLIGGNGWGVANCVGALDDVWEFNPATNEWAWMAGPSGVGSTSGESGVYGTLGVAGAGNIPGGRLAAASWTGLDGSFWLMGGEGTDAIGANGYLNDLWEYGAAAAEPTLSVPAGTYTASQDVSISDTTSGASIYYTTDGTTPTTVSTLYSGPVTVSSSETLQAIATASGYSIIPVASATYTIPPDFSVAATPASSTVAAGQNGTTSISVTPANGFNSMVSFSCSGLPYGATCIFSPQTVTPSGGVASTTLSVSTNASMTSIRRHTSPLFPISALAALVCCVGWKRRRLFQFLGLIVVGVIGFSLLNGCGSGGGGGSTGPQSATWTITVNATSGSLQHSTTFSLTVN